uniref:Transmembrane protein n=1 Tax=Populus alba TaxID=43335 RepID=A0A4U5NLA4_POPAL|nr:hypothetical protein D5086_0000268480 [Populus alba]
MLTENLGRLKVRKGKERREAQKELEQSIHLVKAPQVLRQDQSLTLPKIKVEVSQPKSEKKSGNGRVILLASSLVCIFALFSLFFLFFFFASYPVRRIAVVVLSAFLPMRSFAVKVIHGGIRCALFSFLCCDRQFHLPPSLPSATTTTAASYHHRNHLVFFSQSVSSSSSSIQEAKGEAQAETSRQMLIDDSFDVCFSSPLIRSKRTAEIIWGSRKVNMITDSDLRRN